MEYDCEYRHCPPYTLGENGVSWCCKNCYKSKKQYITDTNKHLWTDDRGFWSPSGCKLSRKDMPQECREYDCRKGDWLYKVIWQGDKWIRITAGELLPGSKVVIIHRKDSKKWQR